MYPMERRSHYKRNWDHWVGTRRTVRDKFNALAVHCLFLLAMHPTGSMKASALLTGDI